jgi:hypothetical protein
MLYHTKQRDGRARAHTTKLRQWLVLNASTILYCMIQEAFTEFHLLPTSSQIAVRLNCDTYGVLDVSSRVSKPGRVVSKSHILCMWSRCPCDGISPRSGLSRAPPHAHTSSLFQVTVCIPCRVTKMFFFSVGDRFPAGAKIFLNSTASRPPMRPTQSPTYTDQALLPRG